MVIKPTKNLDWVVSNDPLKIIEPTSLLKSNGYQPDEYPACENHNWIFNIIDNWTKYFNDNIEQATLVFDGTESDIATTINALADDSFVFIKNSVYLSTLQTITKRIKFKFASNARLILTNALTSGLIFQARPHFQNLKIEVQNNITNAIRMSANFRIDSCEIIMNGSGKTLTNTILVDTGFKGIIQGITTITSGSITNLSGIDTDGNSQIVIL